jgi:isochorismate pyruvate lyase
MILPEDCTTMAEVRAGVDATDRALADLIGRRFGYMNAAARIKPMRAAVRDEARKAEVLANARANAAAHGWSPDVAEALWEALVEASIAYEFEAFDRLRAPSAAD